MPSCNPRALPSPERSQTWRVTSRHARALRRPRAVLLSDEQRPQCIPPAEVSRAGEMHAIAGELGGELAVRSADRASDVEVLARAGRARCCQPLIECRDRARVDASV